ncbi:MAG: hypothetical protein KY453_06870, partial [Gemmatimonadetes bacterium]|nr:hypothetical protein [Gemmatimonadota bacterium]
RPMPKRTDPLSDLMTIGFFAPLVVAARLGILAKEAGRPTRRGRREVVRMTAEKPLALAEGAVAAQQAISARSLKFWSDTALAAHALALNAPAAAARASPCRAAA